jgi:uncharacterized protein (TIGR02996 family)
MNCHEDFLNAIHAAPNDGALRLVYADWLDEHGESARAEYLRLENEIVALLPKDARRRELRARLGELRVSVGEDWFRQLDRTLVDVPESVKPRFVAAGWFPGRRVSVSAAVPRDHPAADILAELGGLTVTPKKNGGEECGTSDLVFRELHPDEGVTGVWGQLLATRLVGVAEVCVAHGELYVAADGRCFGRSNIHDAFYFEGDSFAEALERHLFGRRARPMLRPDQKSVSLYGISYTRRSPELYQY